MVAGSPAATPRDVEAPRAAPEPRHIDFGLVIGVDHYPRFRSLQGAIADATSFHSWLCEADGGGLAPEHARLIVSRPEPAAPLQHEVDEQLLELVTEADELGGGRRLYFHFSGHGASSSGEAGEDVALLLARWSRSLARLALSTDGYRSALGAMGLFEEIVISLDCCRTTAMHAVGLPPTLTHEPRAQPCATRTFLAYATELGRPAFEVPAPEGGRWQGVFTRCLLEILRGAPHGISAADLKHALEYRMAARGQQAHVVNGLRDDSRFGRRSAPPRLVIELVEAREHVRLRNGSRAVIAERAVGPEPWELSLEAGLYKLEDAAGRAITFEHGEGAETRVRL
ncbi:MAG TPA: caspase family protein [Kofleriaceae bacterium]|nr:caspase family protein [Kofleriaceae bacterium]